MIPPLIHTYTMLAYITHMFIKMIPPPPPRLHIHTNKYTLKNKNTDINTYTKNADIDTGTGGGGGYPSHIKMISYQNDHISK